jgi:hypothetical protein
VGEHVNSAILKAQALPALLTGISRQPLPFASSLAELADGDGAKAALNALSLTAQALRFERPPAPPNFNTEPEIHDDRAILLDRMRRPLIQILQNKKTSADLELALAWAFDRAKVRPHPFDLPRVDAFVRAHAENLGLTAQHWVERNNDANTAVAPAPHYFAADTVDDSNWASAPLAERARYLADRRKQDPAAANALLEGVWSQQNADARVRLLMALETGLSSTDQTFLEAIVKDRAPRVRTLAQRFLARITGSSVEHPALKRSLERIQRSTTGLLKKRATLTLELPATIKEHEVKAWIRNTFEDVSLDELARAFEMTPSEMIEAAEKDEKLLLAFALMATADGRLDLLEQITQGCLPDAWGEMALCGVQDLSRIPRPDRLDWAKILVRPYAAKPPVVYSAWSWMHRSIEGPVPELAMEPILSSNRWLSDLVNEQNAGAEWMELLAAVCPTSQRDRLRSQLALLDPSITVTASPLLDILDSIEKAGQHD